MATTKIDTWIHSPNTDSMSGSMSVSHTGQAKRQEKYEEKMRIDSLSHYLEHTKRIVKEVKDTQLILKGILTTESDRELLLESIMFVLAQKIDNLEISKRTHEENYRGHKEQDNSNHYSSLMAKMAQDVRLDMDDDLLKILADFDGKDTTNDKSK